MKIKHSNARSIPPAWDVIISKYLTELRVGGYSPNTIHSRREHLHVLARRIACMPSEVTADRLVEYLAEQNWAQETRRGRNNTFRLFWRWAHSKGILQNVAKDLPMVKQSPGVPRPTPESVYLEALAKADGRTRLILRLAAECGLRRGEIAQLHSRDIIEDLVGWSVIAQGKGNKERIVPLPPGLASLLHSQPPGYVFPGQINGHVSVTWIGKLATNVLKEGWTLHTLRARFATRAYEVDRDVFAVQELLGHSSPETTRRYVRTDPNRLRRLVESAANDHMYTPAHTGKVTEIRRLA